MNGMKIVLLLAFKVRLIREELPDSYLFFSNFSKLFFLSVDFSSDLNGFCRRKAGDDFVVVISVEGSLRGYKTLFVLGFQRGGSDGRSS